MRRISTFGIGGLPMVQPGDDLATLLARALEQQGDRLEEGDVAVVTQKIVSKAENCFVDLADVVPSDRALEYARQLDKDPRAIEVVLSESIKVLRAQRVLITENRLGLIMANAGVDVSNIEQMGGRERVLLLPNDPDASARKLRNAFREIYGVDVAVIINDSAGRPWRKGVTSIAIGTSGILPVVDMRNAPDLFSYRLRITEVALADLVANSANLVMGEAAEGVPAAVVRGLTYEKSDAPASSVLRPESEDLFR